MSVAFPLGRLEDHDVEDSAAPIATQINHACGKHGRGQGLLAASRPDAPTIRDRCNPQLINRCRRARTLASLSVVEIRSELGCWPGV
jgi:hypothetical protein